MAIYQESHTYSAGPTECYQMALSEIQALGFRITRKRDLGWLILAEKTGDPAHPGGTLVATISCRPGARTEVTAVCERRGQSAGEPERAVVAAFFAALDQHFEAVQ